MKIDYIDKLGLVLLLVIIAVLAFQYVKYSQQLKAALQEEKGESPLYSQKELTRE
jgi:hypothetical protein